MVRHRLRTGRAAHEYRHEKQAALSDRPARHHTCGSGCARCGRYPGCPAASPTRELRLGGTVGRGSRGERTGLADRPASALKLRPAWRRKNLGDHRSRPLGNDDSASRRLLTGIAASLPSLWSSPFARRSMPDAPGGASGQIQVTYFFGSVVASSVADPPPSFDDCARTSQIQPDAAVYGNVTERRRERLLCRTSLASTLLTTELRLAG